ncbi:sugar ABC transporter substrate-binding protein [Tessaracoccus sp. MC1756]|nr:sugar ABC transporter substrate-binding protein [Tessaracoccus sp. MC1756]
MQVFRRRTFLTGASIAGAAVSLAACSSGDAPSAGDTASTNGGGGGGGTLSVTAANHPWTDYIKPRLGEFEEANKVKIDLSSYQADQLSTMYNTRLQGKSRDLDVMMYRPLQEGVQFSRNGWLLGLGDLSAGAEYKIEDFQESMLGVGQYDGTQYGIPIVTEREVLFYRKDLFEKAGLSVPTTMEELEAAAAALHDPNGQPFGYAMRGLRAPAVTQFSGFLYSFGGDFITDGKASLNTPEAVAAYEFYGKMLREYGPVGVESMSTEQINPLFQQGRVAMFIDAEVFWAELTREGASTITREQLGVAPLPAGPAGSKPYSVASWGLGINANSERQELAWKFVEWATGPEMVLDLQKSGIFGARLSVWENPDSLTDIPEDFAETLRVSTQNGVGYDRPLVVQVGRARDIAGAPIVTSIQGGDVRAAADTAQSEMEQFLVEDASATGTEG